MKNHSNLIYELGYTKINKEVLEICLLECGIGEMEILRSFSMKEIQEAFGLTNNEMIIIKEEYML